MRRIIIGTTLSLVLVAYLLVPYLIDWNYYRSALEEEAKAKILSGSELQVDGDFKVAFFPRVFLSAEKFRLVDGSSKTFESIFKVERISVSVDPFRLLFGRLEINNIDLERPALWVKQPQLDVLLSDSLGLLRYMRGVIRIVDGTLIVTDVAGVELKRVAVEGWVEARGRNSEPLWAGRMDTEAANQQSARFEFSGTLKEGLRLGLGALLLNGEAGRR